MSQICKYCDTSKRWRGQSIFKEDGIDGYLFKSRSGEMRLCVNVEYNYWLENTDEDYYVDVPYCPMCGKKLN